MTTESSIFITEHKIAADPKLIPSVSTRFIEFLLSLGIDDSEKNGWKLAFSEMVNNAIEHGSQSNPKLIVYVRWWAVNNTVWLETEDSGKGPPSEKIANPTLPEDPLAESGRGLYIIANFALSYDHWYSSIGYIARISKQYDRINSVLPLNPEMDAILDELSNCYESLSLFDRMAANLLKDENFEQFVQSGLDMFMDAHHFSSIHMELRAPNANPIFRTLSTIESYGVFGNLNDSGYSSLEKNDALNWFKGRSPCQFSDAQAYASGCGVPLYVGDKLAGLIAVGYHSDDQQIRSNDIRNLRALSDIISVSVSRALMDIEKDAQKRIATELNIATSLQQQLLPVNKQLPDISGYEVFFSSLSAHEIAGDFVEVRQNSAGEYLGCVIDVMGKGISAAILAGIFRSQFIAYAHRGGKLATFLEGVNEALESQLEGATMFITAYVFKLNPISHDFTYAGAGHPPALLYHADGSLEELVSMGPPIGLFKSIDYAQNTVVLAPNDRIVVVTDGLYEWSNGNQIYGWDSMVNWFSSHRQIDAKTLWHSFQSMIISARKSQAIHQEDDETLFILTRK